MERFEPVLDDGLVFPETLRRIRLPSAPNPRLITPTRARNCRGGGRSSRRRPVSRKRSEAGPRAAYGAAPAEGIAASRRATRARRSSDSASDRLIRTRAQADRALDERCDRVRQPPGFGRELGRFGELPTRQPRRHRAQAGGQRDPEPRRGTACLRGLVIGEQSEERAQRQVKVAGLAVSPARLRAPTHLFHARGAPAPRSPSPQMT